MSNGIRWTNKSVLAFALGQDPVHVMEERARLIALEAMDHGWGGPPFDPVRLAQHLSLVIRPRADIPDARTVPSNGGLSIEFNPLRPRGRVRFSIAHEIAHTLFPDCAESVRDRGRHIDTSSDEWQLEVLCNIGAAELLMPTGSFPELADTEIDINELIKLRRKFDVSTEALLIRTVKLTTAPCAAFCASINEKTRRYRLDYLIPSSTWKTPLRAGIELPADTVVTEADAIGFTAVGDEVWEESKVKVQCVSLAPYPGNLIPRAVGIVSVPASHGTKEPQIHLVTGNALVPRGGETKILAHVVPDSTLSWGGGGFAAQLKHKYPQAATQFREAMQRSPKSHRVGVSVKSKISDDLYVFHMIAQRGHGNEEEVRVRYSALSKCLADLNSWAVELGASVHMPPIGTGHGGGDWKVISELILEELVRKGTEVTVYQFH